MASEKEKLIDYLIQRGALTKKEVIAAFRKVPREDFIPEPQKQHAYVDSPLPTAGGQTISAPHMVAVMTEVLDVKNGQRILEIGAGSGYQAAILSALNPKGRIITVELVPEVVELAMKNLAGYKNVKVIIGDGSDGYAKAAPYDRILATCGCPDIPKAWAEQLKDGGRIVAPLGGIYEQRLILAEKRRGKIIKTDLNFPCVFVPMRGSAGWKD
jgi:protein-L-isoaspartate(D-aspartate) O-methyltransferase